MNLPTQMGTYLATPTDWGVAESGDNKIPTFTCRFSLTQLFGADGWVDVSGDGLEITGYFYLFKKDAKPNTHTITALKDSLGWDGRSIANLQSGDWSVCEVQLVIDREEYPIGTGKMKTKVRFMNPRDSVPGGGSVEKADSQVIQSLESKYGAHLRAIAGPAPAAPPAAPARPGGNGAPTDVAAQAARAAAWKAFQAKHPGQPGDALAEPWRAQIKNVISDRSSTTFGAADWLRVQKAIEAPPLVESPISEEPQFKEDDIPF